MAMDSRPYSHASGTGRTLRLGWARQVLQIAFDDGLYSEPATVETPTCSGLLISMATAIRDLRRQHGNTARHCGVNASTGCALRRVVAQSGTIFVPLLRYRTELCPGVLSERRLPRISAGMELVVPTSTGQHSHRRNKRPATQRRPLYEWSVERFRLQDSVIVGVSTQRAPLDTPISPCQSVKVSIARTPERAAGTKSRHRRVQR